MQASARGVIRVAVLDATESTEAALAALPGVASASAAGRDGAEWRFDLTVDDGQLAAVQGAVMRYAAEAGLTVLSNRQESADLEEVFLRIVNKERAA
jgi:hypothetical protein